MKMTLLAGIAVGVCDMPIGTHLVIDFVLLEDYCNRDCRYCKLQKQAFDPDRNSFLMHGQSTYFSEVYNNASRVIDNMHKIYDAPILVLSGGEVSQFPGFLDFAKSIAATFETVQILTNGEGGEEWIKKAYHRIPNLHMKFSLDGHTLEMNSYRRITSDYQSSMAKSIALCVSYNIPVEINCVLTKANISGLADFVEWLRGFCHTAMQVYFLPVRGRPTLRPSLAAIHKSIDALQNANPGIMPLAPADHLESLRDFYIFGRHNVRCLLPFVLVAGYEDGEVGSCTLIKSPRLPRIPENTDASHKGSTHTCLKKILFDCVNCYSAYRPCFECFLDYHIVHSALEGTIEPDQLFNIPLYSSNTVREKFIAAKKKIKLMKDETCR